MRFAVSSIVLLTLASAAYAAGTLTKLSDDALLAPDAGGWGVPRINNVG